MDYRSFAGKEVGENEGNYVSEQNKVKQSEKRGWGGGEAEWYGEYRVVGKRRNNETLDVFLQGTYASGKRTGVVVPCEKKGLEACHMLG